MSAQPQARLTPEQYLELERAAQALIADRPSPEV
jgi:hypothetical protein